MLDYSSSSYIFEPNIAKITDSKQVAIVVRSLIKDKINEKEHFVLITLNGASHVIRKEIIFIGTLNQSLVHPREIFRLALIDNSAGIIIAHNHPSGTLQASSADIAITARLKEVSKLVGIELLDHVIVTELGHYSMSDDRLL